MTENDILYQHILVRDLESFALNLIQSAQPGQFVPITQQRACAHSHNPNADPDDVALLVAVDGDGDIVGYFGILPVMLRIEDQFHKCHWFTTWSVSDKVRGLGVGSGLMREALTLGKDFLIVGSVHARRVCHKFGFWEHDPLPYYWIDPSGMGNLNPLNWALRLARKVTYLLKLNFKIQTTNRTTRAFGRFIAPLTRRFFYPLLSRKLAACLQNTHYKQVNQIRQELPDSVVRPSIELHRGSEVVNWMLAYPWVVQTGESPTEDMDYYFSDTRPRHEFIAFKLLDSDRKYCGFVVFQVSLKLNGTVLKTLDYAITDPRQYHQILALAVDLSRKNDAITIEIPLEVGRSLQKGLLGKIILQRKTRLYQCHPSSEDSPLARAWQDITLHLYDGDMAFS